MIRSVAQAPSRPRKFVSTLGARRNKDKKRNAQNDVFSSNSFKTPVLEYLGSLGITLNCRFHERSLHAFVLSTPVALFIREFFILIL